MSVKGKKRYCDVCKQEMPMYIDFTQQDINPHDLLTLGFKTKSGRTMNKNYDVCRTCMDQIDVILSGQQNSTSSVLFDKEVEEM